MLNGTLGPGMLVLPLSMSRVGATAGAILLFVFWFFSHLGLRRMLDTCTRPRASTLGQAAETHGPRLSALVDVSVVLYFFGTCVSYLILMHSTIRHLISGIWRLGHGRGGAASGAPKGELPPFLSRRDAPGVRPALAEGSRTGVRPRKASAAGASPVRGGEVLRRLAAAGRDRAGSLLSSGPPEGAQVEASEQVHGGIFGSNGRAGLSGHGRAGLRHRHAVKGKGDGASRRSVPPPPPSIAGVLPPHTSTPIDGARVALAAPHPAHPHLSHQHISTLVLIAVAVCVLAPLSCSRSLRALERVSSLVVLAYIYIALALAFGGGEAGGASDSPAALRASVAPEALSAAELPESATGALINCLRAMPLMAYCFSSQPVYPPLVASIHQQLPGRAGRALAWRLVHASFLTTFCIYCSVAMLGLSRSPATPPPNVLLALPNTPALLLANAALVLSVGLSFPLMLIVARSHLYHLLPSQLPSEEDASLRAVSLALLAGALIAAIAFPRVEVCLGLIGATCSVSLSFFVPAWMHWDDLVASKSAVGASRRTASSFGEAEEEMDVASPALTPDAHRALAASILKQRSMSFSPLTVRSVGGTPELEAQRSRWLGMADIVALFSFGGLVAAVTIPMQLGTIFGLM
jgi:amino acid permease